MQLRDKIALVTGAAHRVGKFIALELAEAGAHVVVHYNTSEAQALATVEEIRQKGVRAIAVGGDLSRPESIDHLFQSAEAEFGGVDVLVNSAAVMERGDVLMLAPAEWQRTLAINLTAPFFCAQQAARSMLARHVGSGEAGVIVNIADLSALKPWAKYPAHSVSKAGVVMLTQVLAKALAPRIRVNAVAPGLVVKPPDWDEARWRAVGERALLKRAGSGYDVGRAVRFLIEQDYITGETLVVDGGSLHL
jgi:pteridine reductase